MIRIRTRPCRIRGRVAFIALAVCGGIYGAETWLSPQAVAEAAGAGGRAQARSTGKAASSSTKLARTPWGHPDLQGVWTNATSTPLERPAQMSGKEVLTDEERKALDERAAQNADPSAPAW